MQKFKVTAEDVKKRLDVFLAEALGVKCSRSSIKAAILNGFVLLNNKNVKASHKLKENDEIVFTPPPPKASTATPEDIPINIIYEDDAIVVVNKPAGMVVHPAIGNYSHTLENALLFHCKNLSNLGAPLRPGVVHRLDKDVSGVLVLAKTDQAYRELVKQFKERTINRKYIAFVKGVPALKKGKLELPIGRSRRDRKKMAVTLTGKNAKQAVTYYEVVKQYKGYSELIINLGTGRTHQIRVHTSYIGHPIIGDTHYGGPKSKRLMLHAVSLGFKHPIKGNDLYFEVPLPEEFLISVDII